MDLIIAAIPFFLLSMAVEALALAHAAHEERQERDRGPVGYAWRDTRTSVTMGLGHLFILGGWKFVAAAFYGGIYLLSPFHLPTDAWWVWVLLFFADDLSYYCYHRGHHRVRVFWATHVVHHSSQHYNFSTALRQDWSPFTATLFWAWEGLFLPPWAIFLAISWNLIFQFVLHTEKVDKLWRPIEFVFNTPSHHRVHHGSQAQYIDRNYAGILIIWDRLFGTFEPEGERVRYGLITNIETFNPVRVAYQEFAALWRDVRAAPTWRVRLAHLFRGPGWKPEAGLAGSVPPTASAPPATERLHAVGRPA